MKKLSTLFIGLLFTAGLLAQTTYFTKRMEAVPKAATVHAGELGPDFAPTIQFLEAPKPEGEPYHIFLEQQKQKSSALYPRQPISEDRGGSAEPPLLLFDFFGNNTYSGTPLDNHLAISDGGQIVSVINRHIATKDEAGDWVSGGAFTLEKFVKDLPDSLGVDEEDTFDPRVLYDLENDRFIIFMIAGRSVSATHVVVAFSQSNDMTGEWNLYAIPGNPFDNGSWADYPMIAMTTDEVFLTYNSVLEGEPWETGFFETLIWQIDKESGYQGAPLEYQLWSDIGLGGTKLRNICPITYSEGVTEDRMFFLSNRNFDVENDTIFLLELNGNLDDPDLSLEVDFVVMDQPYGVPPNALQPEGLLQTNDARVLDGFLHNDQIQFVSNTIDFASGQAAVYHGIIDDIDGDRLTEGFLISGGADDLGYPGIAYTGMSAADEDAIIIASHTSDTRFPGWSALYFDNDRQHSSLITVKEGEDIVDFFDNFDLERWGDYSGIQRKYNEPGIVWASSSYGKGSQSVNDTWIAKLGRPDLNVATEDTPTLTPDIRLYPNPTRERVTVEFTAQNVRKLQIDLFDQQGRLVRNFLDQSPENQGKTRFSFNTDPLPTGWYVLKVMADGQLLASKKFVVQ